MDNLPMESNLPTPQVDPDRDAAMRAAVFYDRARQERDDLLRLLDEAKVALGIKDNQIQALKLEVAAERNRHDALQSCYLEALQDRADLESLLAGLQGMFEDQAKRLGAFEFSRLRRKRNGNGKRSHAEPATMSDIQGSETALAELSSLVAQRPAG